MWCFQLSPSSCLLSDLIMHQGHAGDMEACEEDDDEDERCWEASLQKALRGVVADLISELEEEHEHAHVPFCGDPEGRAGQDKTAVQGSSAQGMCTVADPKDPALACCPSHSAAQSSVWCVITWNCSAFNCIGALCVHILHAAVVSTHGL